MCRVVWQKWSKGPGKMKVTYKYTEQSLTSVKAASQGRNKGICGQISAECTPMSGAVWCQCGTDLEPSAGSTNG